MARRRCAMGWCTSGPPTVLASWRSMPEPGDCDSISMQRAMCSPPRRWPEVWRISGATTAAWTFQTDASKNDPMKVLNTDGSFNRDAFAPVFRDFQDMYIDVYRFVSIG